MSVGIASRALSIVGLVVLSAPTAAGTVAPSRSEIDPSLVLISSLDARDELSALDRETGGSSDDRHEPARVFLYSLAVPGSGQLVQGHKRGFVYLVAEAAFWTGFFILNGDGLDKRDAYEDFADARWDYEGYQAFFQENCADTCEMCPEIGCRRLAPCGSQEFYEDIGKYEVYWDWWIVEEGGPGTARGVRDVYWGMRKESNRDLRNARYFVTAAFLNHLVSAVDSFISARGARSPDGSAGDLSLEFDAADGGGGLSCAVVMRY